MLRITMTCRAARMVDSQMTRWVDARDEKGKPVVEARKRRQWNKIADLFVSAAGEFDERVLACMKDAETKIDTLVSEQAEQAREFLANGDTAHASDLEKLVGIVLNKEQRNVNTELDRLSEDPLLGKALCEVDLEREDLTFLRDTWDLIEPTNDRQTRRLCNEVALAFATATELTKEGDRYVPVKPKLVEREA